MRRSKRRETSAHRSSEGRRRRGMEPSVGGRRARRAREEAKRGSQTKAFESLGVSEGLLRGVRALGYRAPTPVQRLAIPRALLGDDVVAMARTGSGKTAAFLLPLLQRVCSKPRNKKGARAIVLAPTRELALQTLQFAKKLSRGVAQLRCTALVGGESMESQFEELARDPDLIVATPGRLLHHLEEVEGMTLRNVECVVFDEADRLFEMGFAEQLRDILRRIPDERQTMLFSATMPSALAEFTQAGLKEPHLVRLDADTKISPDLQMHFLVTKQEEKFTALIYLIEKVISQEEQTIVFVSTRHHAEFLHKLLEKLGHDVACVYGTMDQMARKIHADKFRMRKARFLVVTDVAARGIDIPLLDNVVNFDFPGTPKLFVHRVGRAARAGRKGCAYSLLTREELAYLVDLNLFLGRPLHSIPKGMGPVEAKEMQENFVKDQISCYGSFPQSLIDVLHSRVDVAIQEDADLSSLTRTITNAFKLYLKTRPPASKESCKRAKQMKEEGVYPLLVSDAEANAVPQEQAVNMEAMKERIKKFRPAATVFECQIAPSKHTSALHNGADTIMATKRRVHGKVICKERKGLHYDVQERKNNPEQSSSEEAASLKEDQAAGKDRRHGKSSAKALIAQGEEEEDRFRDKEYFISSIPPDIHANRGFAVNPARDGIRAAVMDLVGDETGDMAKGHRQFHWDKRKKKYVQLQGGEELRATGKRIITESGVKVSKRKTGASGIYEAWVKKSKVRVGQEQDDLLPQENAARGRRPKPPNKPSGTYHVRNELKTPEQVRKNRLVKEKQMDRNRPKRKTPMRRKK